MAELTLSVVVPSHRDAKALADLLPTLAQDNCEIVVVGSEADATTTTLCEEFGARYIHTDPCRGGQLDAGAKHSSGNVIWFLHADAHPPKDAGAQIRTAVSQGATAGFFPFQFAGARTLGKTLLAAAINLRVKLGGIPYGDQGLFAMRQAYEMAGGFPHAPLFEEVRLVKRLRRQGHMIRLPTPLLISPRRWERDGWWQRSLNNRWLAVRFMFGAAPESLARRYTGNRQPPRN
ncbi:MAG: TIGR04283 family arsenosugar biosynthesis glycosyltransferase [Gammaproteobacteria bacterium]